MDEETLIHVATKGKALVRLRFILLGTNFGLHTKDTFVARGRHNIPKLAAKLQTIWRTDS